MINIDNLNELSLYEVDLLIKQIENSPEREDNLQKVMDRRNEIINTSKLGNEVPEDISNMSLKELYEQRELLNDNGKKELDGKIVAKANKEYGNGKGVILTAEELYILRDLLGKASDIGYNGKDIKKCKQKVSRYIDNFENYYGIKQLLPPDKVKENLETIKNNIPSVKDLLNRTALENVKNVLDNLVIKGEHGVLSQKNIKGEEAEKTKNLWMEKVYQETTMYLANTRKDKINDEVFAQEFSARMKLAIVQAQSSKEAVKAAVSYDKNKVQNFDRLIKNLDKTGKKVEIDVTFFETNLAKANVDENTAITRLGPKYAAVADIYKGKNKELDEKCKKQHKTLYPLAKTAFKSGAWGAVYGVAGVTLGPAGVAIVASASCINATWGMYKDYKKQKEKDEKLSFGQYMWKNPTRIAGVALSGASAIMGIGGVTGLADTAVIESAQGLIRGAAISLGVANVLKAYRDAPKGKKWGAALKVAGSFAVGMVAGRAVAGNIGELVPDTQAAEVTHGPITDEKVDRINLEDISKSSPDQQVVGNDSHHNHHDSHHNHHHNHHDSNTQGPGGEGETDATPPEVTESKITTHILESGETYQLPGGYEVTADGDHEITVQEGFTAGEDKYTKVSILENETGERNVMLVGEEGVISQEKYDDQGNIYESTEIINGQEQKTEYQYNENCELSEKLIYDSEGYLKERVEITYNENGDTVYRYLDGNGDPIKTVIKDSDGNMTEQTNGNNDVALDDNNRDSADSVVSDGNDANLNDATLKGGENAGENKGNEGLDNSQTQDKEDSLSDKRQSSNEDGSATPKVGENNNAELDNSQTQDKEDSLSDKRQSSNEDGSTTLKGGGNAGEGNNNAKPEGITAEQTNGNNIGDAEQIKEGELGNSQKVGENAGVGNNNEGSEGITAEQTNGNNIGDAEQVKEGPSDNSQKGGENSGEGNKADNGDSNSGDAKSFVEIMAEVVKENEALNQAYGQHYMNKETGECYVKDTEGNILLKGNDPNELNRNIENHKEYIFNMDNQLHGMKSAGQQDTQEYKELEDKLDGELKKIDMVRDEETGRMMSKGDYTALQEQRQAEAQAGTQAAEKADTTKDNNADQKSSEVKNIADHIKKLSGIDGGGKIHGANETQTHVAKNTNIPKNFPIGKARG